MKKENQTLYDRFPFCQWKKIDEFIFTSKYYGWNRTITEEGETGEKYSSLSNVTEKGIIASRQKRKSRNENYTSSVNVVAPQPDWGAEPPFGTYDLNNLAYNTYHHNNIQSHLQHQEYRYQQPYLFGQIFSMPQPNFGLPYALKYGRTLCRWYRDYKSQTSLTRETLTLYIPSNVERESSHLRIKLLLH